MTLDEADQRHLEEYNNFLKEIDTWMDCPVKDARKEAVENCKAMIEVKR